MSGINSHVEKQSPQLCMNCLDRAWRTQLQGESLRCQLPLSRSVRFFHEY